MKHPSMLRLRKLAAVAIVAVVPLAAQAQTSGPVSSALTIVVGPEPVVEPKVTCDNPAAGKLIAMSYPGSVNGRAGEVGLFTTNEKETDIPSGLVAQAAPEEDISANATEPGLNFGWSYGSTSATRFVRLVARLPLDAIAPVIAGTQTVTSARFALPAVIGTTGDGQTSHVYLKGLDTLAATGANVTQTWNASDNTLTVDIKRGSDNTLPERTAVPTKLDITLQSPTGVHLKAATNPSVTIRWTCSTPAYPSASGGV